MEVIGFILAAIVMVGLVPSVRSRARLGPGCGRGSANPTWPDKS